MSLSGTCQYPWAAETMIESGGSSTVTPPAQLVYLDFDGELTSYNGEAFTVDEVIVDNSNLPIERIALIVEMLNTMFSSRNVVFVSEQPEIGEYSTVFVGKTAAFAELGNIRGIAETIDTDNRNRSDNAFVLLNAESSDTTIVTVIAHEVGHLLGDSHEDEGVEAYLAGGTLYISGYSSGLVLSSATVDYQYAHVLYGYVDHTTAYSGAAQYVSSGAVVNATTLFGGSQFIYFNGAANNTVISNGGLEEIASGGVANWTNIYSGRQLVLSGGAAEYTSIYGGVQEIYSGGSVNGTIISGGTQVINSGGRAENTSVYAGGKLYFSGGFADGTIINSGGTVTIYSGGIANGVTVSSGGTVTISSGGSAASVAQSSGGVIQVDVIGGDTLTNVAGSNISGAFWLSNGTASNFYLNGSMTVHSGGTALQTNLASDGVLKIHSGGMVVGTTGNLYAGTINVGGTLDLRGVVIGGSSADLTFLVNERSAGDTAMVINLNNLGTASSYTVNASSDQDAGTYLLANGVTAFSSTMNFTIDGLSIDTISIDSPLEYLGHNYILNLSGGNLTLTIQEAPEPASLTVTINLDVVNNLDNLYSLREALVIYASELAVNGSAVITFDPVTAGTVIAFDSAINQAVADTAMNGNGTSDTVISGGQFVIDSGQVMSIADLTLYNTVINSAGFHAVLAGGAAVNTIINSSGIQAVSSGGDVNNTIISSGGSQIIYTGGIANNTIIEYGGIMVLGGIISGSNTVGGSMLLLDTATAASGTVVVLDVSQRQTSDGVMINTLTYLTTGINQLRTSGGLSSGTYNLAGSASSFGSNLNIGFNGGGADAIGNFYWLSPNSRYAGTAEDNVRYVIQYDSNGNLQLYVHTRYEVQTNINVEYLAEDASYHDMRLGSSAGIYGSLNQTYTNIIYGGGLTTEVTGQVTLDVESSALLTRHLYAGGRGQDVLATRVNLAVGAVVSGYLFGGGRNAEVTNAVLNASGGTVDNLFGGGQADGSVVNTSAQVSSATLIIGSSFAGLKSNSYIFGGGMALGAASAASTVYNVTITISGGNPCNLHGGGYATAGTAEVGTVTINVNSGTFSGYLFGGGRAVGVTAVTSVQSVDLNITGGTFSFVLGGGYAESGAASTVDAVNITISGGTFNGTVYGGAQVKAGSTGSAIVNGDITIIVDVSGTNIISFRGGSGITTGGSENSVVTGNTTLTLTGSGSNLQTAGDAFTGWLSAASDSGTDSSKTHTLSFRNFIDDDFQAHFLGFNLLNFSGSTALVISRTTNWSSGMNYGFDLGGRSSNLADIALMQQESGSLSITADSVFKIELNTNDLYDSTGSFLLMDGMDGQAWSFGSNSVSLIFNNTEASGTFNGGILMIDNVEFSLVYTESDGQFLLSWSSGNNSDNLSLLQSPLQNTGILA